ncbi:AraC family transcriptional regulator [Amycolatopsis sp. cmx-11-12]|uniref:AraC family transcriptional regulator n=1 Tax=Amycolatopsis sp. cmx-11-12 TaxID=2785795 RepID=UPI003917FF75
MSPGPQIAAWRPSVSGLIEVFHARFSEHRYPMHTHDAWTLLIVDQGAVSYVLDRHEHGAASSVVTLLPPHVPHDGRAANSRGFRKRVLYLDPALLGQELIGAAVDRPAIPDRLLHTRVHRLHQVLKLPDEELETQSRLTLVVEHLQLHLRRQEGGLPDLSDAPLARRLRDLLDARIRTGLTLSAAAELLAAHPAHLVRTFTKEYGIAPHQYLTGRRVDLARRMLLAGTQPADVASAVGFYDQAHLSRHFKRLVGVGPGCYARHR